MTVSGKGGTDVPVAFVAAVPLGEVAASAIGEAVGVQVGAGEGGAVSGEHEGPFEPRDQEEAPDGSRRLEPPKGRTVSGREVVVCHCGGGPAHEWKPNGGGMRILACPSDWPAAKRGSM